ncbi:MAG TPA: SpoIIE family protein phosphatase [Spirochaetota bacterium]|nr:SpoIIE family protein phosphatase [Spirochaetota bacterium]HPS87425.1 SpoIIE family protein phosphatase [Spirochaetota bacterium]
MDTVKIIENILAPFENIAKKSGIEYIEFLNGGENNKSLYKKSYSADFPYLAYEVLESNPAFKSRDLNIPARLELTSKYEFKIFCHIYPLKRGNAITDLLIIETKTAADDDIESLISYISAVIINFFMNLVVEKTATDNSDKYKKEIGNMRDIQAKLFPKFDEIKELDIRSAYLPAEFMSGTFIDGIFLDNTTYQLSACDVSEYGPASSFVGAAIRTIIRSDASQKKIPSAMIESINNKIKNMISGPAGSSSIFLTIYQLNLKTGKVVISSLGNITTLFYTKKRNGLIDLASTETGKLFSNRNFLRDMTVNLEPGDALLYYTRGVKKARPENSDTEYGLNKLKDEMKLNIESGSLEIVHSIIESIYEFTDYAQLNEDIILISMKRND